MGAAGPPNPEGRSGAEDPSARVFWSAAAARKPRAAPRARRGKNSGATVSGGDGPAHRSQPKSRGLATRRKGYEPSSSIVTGRIRRAERSRLEPRHLPAASPSVAAIADLQPGWAAKIGNEETVRLGRGRARPPARRT